MKSESHEKDQTSHDVSDKFPTQSTVSWKTCVSDCIPWVSSGSMSVLTARLITTSKFQIKTQPLSQTPQALTQILRVLLFFIKNDLLFQNLTRPHKPCWKYFKILCRNLSARCWHLCIFQVVFASSSLCSSLVTNISCKNKNKHSPVGVTRKLSCDKNEN